MIRRWLRAQSDRLAFRLRRYRYVLELPQGMFDMEPRVYRHDLMVWCRENMRGRWRWGPSYRPTTICFQTEADRVQFKLRWSEDMRRGADYDRQNRQPRPPKPWNNVFSRPPRRAIKGILE